MERKKPPEVTHRVDDEVPHPPMWNATQWEFEFKRRQDGHIVQGDIR